MRWDRILVAALSSACSRFCCVFPLPWNVHSHLFNVLCPGTCTDSSPSPACVLDRPIVRMPAPKRARCTPVIREVKLSNGVSLPAIGYGVWPGPAFYGAWGGVCSLEGTEGEVFEAIQAGYRQIDTAPTYFNQPQTGRGIRKAISEGVVTREDLHVTTKLWNTQWDNPRAALTLEMGLSFIDLYLVHCPFGLVGDPEAGFDQTTQTGHGDSGLRKLVNNKSVHLYKPYHQLWAELEALVDEGLTRSIGVSNFPVILLHDMLAYARHKPVVNQIEVKTVLHIYVTFVMGQVHPYFTNEVLATYCQSQDIAVTAYCPLGAYLQPQAGDNAQKGVGSPLADETIVSIAGAHGCTAAQVCMAWSVSKGYNVLTKTSHAERMRENLAAGAISLTPAEVSRIDALDKGMPAKICNHAVYNNVPYYHPQGSYA